ncbi:MAG: sensor histidine kinase [Gaiellaceae bacterium]
MEPLHVDDALAGLRSLLGRLAGPHIDLVIECEAGLPPVRFESGALRRILVELVQTSSSAIPDRGRIAVRAEAKTDRVLLRVADTGPGVAVDELPRVFEPFHEAQRRGASAEAGLAAVYELVVAGGADIRVSSTPGGGARFSIYLPVWA